jgi:iron complex transport system substrate-binding protein
VLALPKDVLPSYLARYKADKYVNAGGIKEPDFEKINSLKPDLIIISDRQAQAYQELSAIAPTINLQVDQTNFMASFKANMQQIGSLFNKKDQVAQELKKIDDQIAVINSKARTSNERALIIMTTGGKLHGFGPGSRFALVHDVLGLKSAMEPPAANAKNEIHGKIVTFEYIADANPDYLFVIDRDDAIGQSAAAKQLLNNDLINKTKAGRSAKIVYLNSGMWYLSGGGLVSVAAMVDEVARVVR